MVLQHHSSPMAPVVIKDDGLDPLDSSGAVDEEIPTVDYSFLFSSDHHQRSIALQHLSNACEEYGFFNLVNHGVADSIVEGALKVTATFFNEEDYETKKKYMKRSPMDEIVYNLNSHDGENREYLKFVTHPYFNCPQEISLREALQEYMKGMETIKFGLAKAISKILGLEEDYIERVFNFKLGFDIGALNLYPPSCKSKSTNGLPFPTDPGFIITLTQDVNGGLRIRTHSGKWIKVTIPNNAILIQLGDHLEVLTNGKFKSHVHHVVLDNNKVQRVSLVGVHGPALDTLVSPASEFLGPAHPSAYRGLTYKESFLANDNHLIDVTSCLEDLRL